MMAIRRTSGRTISSPHDAYVKSVFRELPQARGFFRGYLPDEVRDLFDWRTLQVEPEAFVSDELERDFADLRFTIRLLGDQVPRGITLLFEHKQRPNPRTGRQLLRYISRQMEEAGEVDPLPAIVTVVLLQSGTWKGARTLSREYDLPEPARRVLMPYLLDFRSLVVELVPLDEKGLKGTEAGRLALALLKAVGDGHPTAWLRYRTILADLCHTFRPDRLRRELRRALYYLLEVVEADKEGEVLAALHSVQDEFLPVKEQIVTLLEHLEKRGEKRGEERGEKRGKVETLVRQLSAAFPEFSPADAEWVRQLADSTLDQLTDAIALRRSWDEIQQLLGRADD